MIEKDWNGIGKDSFKLRAKKHILVSNCGDIYHSIKYFLVVFLNCCFALLCIIMYYF